MWLYLLLAGSQPLKCEFFTPPQSIVDDQHILTSELICLDVVATHSPVLPLNCLIWY